MEALARLSRPACSDMGEFLSFDPDVAPVTFSRLDLRKARRRDQLSNICRLKQMTRTIPWKGEAPTVVRVHFLPSCSPRYF